MKKKSKKSKPKAKAKKAVKVKAKKAAPKKKAASKKKAAPKKSAKKKTSKGKNPPKPKMQVIPPPNSVLVGRVEDFYAQVGVIAFTVKKPIQVGDRLHVLGHTTQIEQPLDSMQINHQAVNQAGVGDAVGIKVGNRARRGDYVFIIKG